MQSSWLELLRALPGIRTPRVVTAWLATTTRRVAWQRRARSRRDADDPGPALEAVADPGPAPGERLLAAERDRVLWRHFASLSERCRDPPPADLDERVLFALALDDLNAQVARLAAEELAGSGARAGDRTHRPFRLRRGAARAGPTLRARHARCRHALARALTGGRFSGSGGPGVSGGRRWTRRGPAHRCSAKSL